MTRQGTSLSISGVTEPTPDGETRQYDYTANRLTSVTAKETAAVHL